jgi:DNA-binding NarL/FixJ family response regulator
MSSVDSCGERNRLLQVVKHYRLNISPQKTMTGSDHRPTVVIADDHAGILRRVSEILDSEFQIVAAVGDGMRSIEAAAKYKPDVMVLDIAMPRADGIQAAREIKLLGLCPRIVFLTVQEDADYVQAANQLGACYVLKSRMHIDLTQAIKEALAGRTFVSVPLAPSQLAR